MLRLENIVDPVIVGRAAIRRQVKVSVRLGEVSAADESFAFEHGRLELQLVRAALFCNRLDALVVVGLIQSVALSLSFVCEIHEAVREIRESAQAGEIAVTKRSVRRTVSQMRIYLRLKLVLLRVCPTKGGASQICRDPLVAAPSEYKRNTRSSC